MSTMIREKHGPGFTHLERLTILRAPRRSFIDQPEGAVRMRRSIRRTPTLAATAVSLALAGATALALPTSAPANQPSDPGCHGNIVATFNSNSGASGASGNPTASAGPGYFLRQYTSQTVHAVQERYCP